jgi:guanosine-3',5'-bis(diphosphate) 3'-pyrophosphohydrolase
MGDVGTLRRIALAVDLAARAHEGQRRGAGRREAFVSHVMDVARRVSESSALDEETLLAAILHDVVEKTDHDLEEVRQMFGTTVASVVAELTDDLSLSGRERKRRQIEEAMHFSDRAKRIKLADKASKLASIAAAPPRWWGRSKAAAEVAQARKVATGLRGVDPTLEQVFDQEAQRADDALGH